MYKQIFVLHRQILNHTKKGQHRPMEEYLFKLQEEDEIIEHKAFIIKAKELKQNHIGELFWRIGGKKFSINWFAKKIVLLHLMF